MTRLRIELAKTKCRSFGNCTKLAPEVFVLDAEKKVSVVEGASAPEETIVNGARSCPYRVIALFDENTGGQVFPPVRK